MIVRTVVENRFVLPLTSQKTIQFNGSSDYATVPITPDPNGFSVGFWFSKNGLGNNERMVDCTDAASDNGFRIGFSAGASNKLVSLVIDNAGSSTAGINTVSIGFVRKWNYLTVTFKPNEAKFFLNAVQTGATDTSCAMGTPTVSLTLGKHAGSSSFFAGRLYRFTLQNTATPWTQTQIDDLYYRNVIPTGATQWSMNNVATDQNGANALTLNGTSYVTDAPFGPRTAI